jgi:Tfp pilus assembly PilM family ATPase
MATTVNERVQKRRDSLRQAGLRPIQLWVPDTSLSSFARECKRQSKLLADDPAETSALEWIEAAANVKGWKS